MAEVKTQPVWRVERATLGDMIPKRAAQRLVQQVGGRVIGADVGAPRVIDDKLGPLTGQDLAAHDFGHMQEQPRHLLGVIHPRCACCRADQAGITDLATGFGIKRRLVDDDGQHLARGRARLHDAIAHQCGDLPLGDLGIVAQELRRPALIGKIKPDRGIGCLARAGPSRTRLGLLRIHRGIKAGCIDRAALFAQRILRQIQREAEGVVKLERRLTGKGLPIGKLGQLIFKQLEPAIQRGAETLFFQLQCLGDQRLRAAQLRIGLAHLGDQRRHQLMHHRVFRTEQMRMAHRAAHDQAQHIAAPLVRGHHAIGNQERTAAQMVGDHAVMNILRPVRIDRTRMGRSLDQRAHQIRVVIIMLALQQRADPFQPHAGIDRLHIKRAHRAIGELLVLHEDDVPDLDETISILIRAARWAAPDVIAVIIENLCARAAGAGRAHLPEIVRGRDTDDPILGHAHLFP